MPRLVQIFSNDSKSPGGTERVIGNISSVAASAGFEVKEFSDESFRLSPWSHRLPMLNIVGNIWQLSNKIKAELRPSDVVVTHGLYGAFLRHPHHVYVYHSVFAAMAEAVKKYVPKLDYAMCRYVWGSFLEGLCTRNAAHRVAVSGSARMDAIRYYGRSSDVIWNSIDSRFCVSGRSRLEVRAQLGLPLHKRILLVVGRREILKGRLLLQDIAPKLPEDVLLASLGSGPSLGEKCLCIEPCEQQVVPLYYQAADWTLNPSIYEGFGLTILESLACGTPVISAPVGVAGELAGLNRGFDTCLAARSDCSESLLQAILRGLADPGCAAEQVEWSKALISSKFSEEVFKSQWLSVLSKMGGCE